MLGPDDIETDIVPETGAVVGVEVGVEEVVVSAEDENIQLPRPEQRSYPTKHFAPLLPDVMSRKVRVEP